MKLRAMFVCGVVLLLSAISVADEGMWLFNAFPNAKVKAKYGFAPDPAWLDHVRLSSVRFNNGGSGSFVSPDGLTFTNHHIASTCLGQISTPQKDFQKIAFYAKTRAEEGYYLLKGTLTEYTTNDVKELCGGRVECVWRKMESKDKPVYARSRDVSLKSFPQDLDEAPKKKSP